MATLHVRNFPDALYERLRAEAERNGRSIGAEAVFLLQSAALAGMTAGYPPARRRRRARTEQATPFEHFSPRARQIVARAHDEARELGSAAIGTEHLLLGLLRDTTAPITLVLEGEGIAYAGVRHAIASEPTLAEPAEVLAFSPGAKKAMELALRDSLDRGNGTISPYNLLHGIAAEADGPGARVLIEHGFDANASIKALRRLSRQAAGTYGFGAPLDDFRVVELEGDAPSWEAQLNELAALGYELVQIVDRRAIFTARERVPDR